MGTDDQRWPITEVMRKKAVDIIYKIVTEGTDPRVRISAARLLVQMDAQNVTDGAGEPNRFTEILRRLQAKNEN